MDNNFYEETRERKSVNKQNKKSVMSKIIVIQLVLCLATTGILYLICKNDTPLSQSVKTFYTHICEKDMTAAEILNVFKSITKSAFSPSVSEKESGETDNNSAGEKSVFSPVYLTVNFVNPVNSNNITSLFGYRISPITEEYSMHTGLDIASPENSPIYAVYNGTVEKTDYNEIRGNYVVIRHSEHIKTLYNHCNKILVKENERVKQGETVALVGSTGYSTGNHLHFEVLLDGKYINPLWVLEYEI